MAAAAAAAAAALRRLGSRVKVQKRPFSFVKGRTGVWVPEDICRKSGFFEDFKEVMTKGWARIDERVRGVILETCTKSAVMTVWGAGVFTVTNTLERLGVIDTGLSSTVKLKEHIAAVVKAENEKTILQLKNQHDEDRAQLKKLSKEFDAHRALTKMWLSHLMEKTLDPLSCEEISKIQEAFALFDKDGDGCVTREQARAVLEMLGDNFSEAELQNLLVETGKISIAEFLQFMADKVKHAETLKQEEEVTPEASSSP